jgi:hypothetical protein
MEFAWANALTDEKWAETLLSKSPLVPDMPSERVQQMYVGSSGVAAFRDPAIFWQLTKTLMHEARPFSTAELRVLDVGVGWGRFYRWLLRDLGPHQLTGVDVDASAIQMCKEMIPYGNFELVDGDNDYPSPFDLAIFYSVFSHLSESVAIKVLEKTWSCLSLNGFVALTVLRASHVNIWANQEEVGYYKESLKLAVFDKNKWLDRLSMGEHLYVPTGGGDLSRPRDKYGEAVIPQKWFEDLPGYRLISYDCESSLPQTYVMLQKKIPKKS